MKISIITVTLNNKAGLLRAIESVRSQTYKNVEHIIVDGGSTDGTVEAMNSLCYPVGIRVRQAGDQLAIKNDRMDLSSRSQRNQERETKISLPTSRDRNDSKDDMSSRIPNGMRDLKNPDKLFTPAGIQNNKSLSNDHYSLVFVSEKDNGIYDAINKGIRLATGDVIGLLHSDDFYADEFVLERYAEVFLGEDKSVTSLHRNDKGMVEAVYSDLVYVKDKAKSDTDPYTLSLIPSTLYPTPSSTIRYWKAQKSQFTTEAQKHREILNGWMPPHPTLFLRKEVFEKYGLYRTDMKIAADYEMILRLFYEYKITSHYLPVTTYCMTIGGASNKSLKNILRKSSEDYQAMKLHGLPFPIKTLLLKNLLKLPQFFRRNS